jgi:nucleotide-binding universal stress UspA family protein
MSMYSRILVAIDGGATSERGLREALALAADQKARLVVLNVINDFPLMVDVSAMYIEESLQLMRRNADELMQAVRRRAAEVGVEIDAVVADSTGKRVADVVVDTARDHRCDLIVMGSHGRRGFNRLTLGSDAELVLRAAPVPLLIVRSAEAGQ